MIILGTNSIKDAGGFNVANSLRFNSGSSDYLNRTPGSASNKDLWSISAWVKRTKLGGYDTIYGVFDDSSNQENFGFLNSDKFQWQLYQSGGVVGQLTTNRLFRDVGSWYHILGVYDSANGTAGNRMRLYINGVEETSFATDTNPSDGQDSQWNSDKLHMIGGGGTASGGDFFDGYISELVAVDGTALSPTDVGEFDSDSGIWKPINVSGLTFGTNGFYLQFEQSGTSANSSGMGADTSGNTHHFSVNNLTAVDQSIDTCTNNFATLNPLSVNTNQGTFSEGNLQLLHGSNAFRTGFASIGATKGKWYCEIKRVTATSFAVGVISLDFKSITPNITYMGGVGTPNLGYFRDGNTGVNGSETSGFASYANGDTLMIGLDLDNGKVYFGKNGTWGNSGDPTSGSTGTGARSITVGGETWSFGVSVYNATAQCNFGSPPYAISSGNTDGDGFGNFEYAVPSGYFSLCTKNLAEYG